MHESSNVNESSPQKSWPIGVKVAAIYSLAMWQVHLLILDLMSAYPQLSPDNNTQMFIGLEPFGEGLKRSS